MLRILIIQLKSKHLMELNRLSKNDLFRKNGMHCDAHAHSVIINKGKYRIASYRIALHTKNTSTPNRELRSEQSENRTVIKIYTKPPEMRTAQCYDPARAKYSNGLFALMQIELNER